MRVAVSRRGWWASWFLAGSAVLGAAWWGLYGGVAGPSGVPLALDDNTSGAAQAILAKQPLAFEPNRGQSDDRVLFLSRNPGYSLFLTAQGAVLGLNGVAQPLSFTWQGASAKSPVQGMVALPAKHNYLRGNNPKRWQRDIPTYEKVRYPNLYPGIDLVYYGRQQHLEYDLVVAPGADPAAIRLRVAGMDALRVGDDGGLRLQVAHRAVTLSKPVIYQETAGERQAVAGGYVLLADNQVGLKLASYDRSKPLVIDPVLSYSSYLGGNGLDQGKGVAVDGAGNIYVVGQSASADFPIQSASQSTSGGDTDAFVAKFNAAGTLQYATYLGGSGTDRGFAIAMDNADAAVYIVGDTDSTDFPVTDATSNSGEIDAFIAKLSSNDLTPGFASYFGGSKAEEALGVAVDGFGNAYVAGATLSNDFPAPIGALNLGSGGEHCDDPSNPGTKIPCSDAYVVKYDPTGVKQYATFLGGYYEDAATAIAVNSGGEAYLTGITYSTDFPVGSNGFQQHHAGGNGDAFILKLDNSGAVVYGTYLGGGGWDQGQAIAVDGSGNVYVAGATNSGSSTSSNPLPIPSVSVQRQFGGGSYDAFAAKITPSNPLSSQLRYLTYLGGGGKDFAYGIAVDGNGNAYVVGETTSTDFPLDTALQTSWFGAGKNNWGDAFISKIDKAGYFLNWSTYLGGGDDDWANSVALDGSGGIYVAGSSFSTDFPTENPFQPNNAGNGDALLFKLIDSPVTADLQVAVSATPDPVGSGETLTYQVVVSNLSTSNDAGGVVTVTTLPGGISFSSASPAGSCSASGAQVTCNVGSIAAGGSATTTLQTVSNTAGDITFTAKVARANQPDPDLSNNSVSVTTTAAVGSSGGGAWSLEWLVTMIVYVVRRRRDVIQSSV